MIQRPGLSNRILLALLVCGLWLGLPGHAANPAPPSDGQANGSHELASIREANRLLEEEIKLAAAPQIYLLLDLSTPSLQIKGRGIELHRFDILSWTTIGATSREALGGVYRLQTRPAVERPKVQPAPGKDPDTEPINLSDMPAEYALRFDPGLLVTVAPPADEHPWLWARGRLREGWRRIAAWTSRGDERAAVNRTLRLTLSSDEARSLAWAATDGMPLLIGLATAR